MSALKTVDYASLPSNIKAAAFDAALADANEYGLRFGQQKPQLDVDRDTAQMADLFINHAGAIVTGGNPVRVDRAAFSAQMKTLAEYMQENRIATIKVPMSVMNDMPANSVLVGAVNALFG